MTGSGAEQPFVKQSLTSIGRQRGLRTMKTLLSKLQTNNPWNKGKLIGQKAPLTMQEIWSIRMRLQDEDRKRDLALFNLAIDSKLRACDLLQIRLSDVSNGSRINKRASICQQKTGRPVRFEITSRTRKSIKAWVKRSPSAARRSILGVVSGTCDP